MKKIYLIVFPFLLFSCITEEPYIENQITLLKQDIDSSEKRLNSLDIYKDTSGISESSMEVTTTSKELSSSFKMNEKYFSIGTVFKILSDDELVGLIEERTINLTSTFEYFDNNHKLKAKAVKTLFSWGVEIIIYDENGKTLGFIKEDVLNSMFGMSTVYYILDQNKKELGKSKKLDFIGTDIEIFQNDKKVIEMTRPMFNIGSDEWEVNILDNSIDKRILVFIPAYKTSADNKRKKD